MNKRTLLIFLFILFAGTLTAQPPEPPARQIMERALHKTSWKDMQGNVTLILINARGEKRIRKIEMFSRKRTENENDMLMRFLAPADVRNTAFLIIEHEKGEDERYLYLPALRRVKKIASSGKGGNFMSSDFSYYDIGRPKLDDWRYRRLADETIDGHLCYRIECLPATPQIAKDTGYGKIIRWLRQDILVTVKSLYYDRGIREWKALTVPKIEKIGDIWFQTDMVMKDLQSNHQSEMIFSNIRINQHIPASFFSVRYLQRIH